MIMVSTNRFKYYVYGVSCIANLFVFLFVYAQVTQINGLNDSWTKSAESGLATATELTKMERSLGYVGFIHQFKNFIIRGEENYYTQAKKYYQDVEESIKKLDELLVNEQDTAHLKTISQTINEYLHKLELAKEKQDEIPIYTLDQLVKVQDADAKKALTHLREAILPKLKRQQLTINNQVNNLKKTPFYLAFILIPFFLAATMLTIILLNNLLRSFKEISMIFEMTPDGIIYSDINGSILKANKAASTIFGYSQQSFTSMKIEDLLPTSQRVEHNALRENFMSREQKREMGSRSNKIEAIKKDGSIIEVKISISSQYFDGKLRSVCVVKDVTEQNKLEQDAQKDYLTNLYNRRYFDDVIYKELKRRDREGRALSLLLIDLDHFKNLNDAQGHVVGDMALKELADFLRNNTRDYDHIARWGGDEFALICPDLNIEDSYHHAEKIRKGFESLKHPWREHLTLSIGISTASSNTPYSVKGLMLAADKAVYAAKNGGRNQVVHENTLKEFSTNT